MNLPLNIEITYIIVKEKKVEITYPLVTDVLTILFNFPRLQFYNIINPIIVLYIFFFYHPLVLTTFFFFFKTF